METKVKLYTKTEFESTIQKFFFGGRYDFGRKNVVDLNDTFKFYGFDPLILTAFIIDFKKELNMPERFLVHAELNMKLRNFINKNILIINAQAFNTLSMLEIHKYE